MEPLVLLTDRTAAEALPGLVGREVKVDALSTESLDAALAARPAAILVDGGELPARAHAVLTALRERDPQTPVIVVLERSGVGAFAWAELVDDVLYGGAPTAEVDLRLALLRRRAGRAEPGTLRLGPLVLDRVTFHATIEGRPLDLTYKEFALLRFLVERPERVFTRPDLLREVWGYDFYGGTRTVDVHVRRLRAKLGPAHEDLVETVRGVGYRAVAAGRRDPSGES
jgi:DNA-binding response OmpR family regulator